jgi:hypothetical protein
MMDWQADQPNVGMRAKQEVDSCEARSTGLQAGEKSPMPSDGPSVRIQPVDATH